MYVHELCSSWMSSPFWKKSFLLNSPQLIDKIIQSQISQAWIDTSKGLDIEQVSAPQEVLSGPEPEVIAEAIETTPRVALNSIKSLTMDQEMGRAASIVGKTKQAVCSMFNEARMGNAVDTAQAMFLVEEIAESVMRNPGALIGLARLKTADDYTYMHSVAVCALMIALAHQLGLSDEETREAGLAGLLHDIGKMAIDSEILNKPGKLTDEEFKAVKLHPAEGHSILLESSGVSAMALDVCLHHHEKTDGSGYPFGLTGDQISLYAKMGAVCDVYDAITSNRPYKAGWCPAESLKKMADWSTGHFDLKVFQAFVTSIGIYPVGTLLLMQSGRLAVVVEQQVGKSLLLPKVRVFFSTKSNTYITPELIDLAKPGLQDKILHREDASKWGLKGVEKFWLGELAPK